MHVSSLRTFWCTSLSEYSIWQTGSKLKLHTPFRYSFRIVLDLILTLRDKSYQTHSKLWCFSTVLPILAEERAGVRESEQVVVSRAFSGGRARANQKAPQTRFGLDPLGLQAIWAAHATGRGRGGVAPASETGEAKCGSWRAAGKWSGGCVTGFELTE